jgi:hypothetical protein
MFWLYICSHHQAGYRTLNNRTIKHSTIKTVLIRTRIYINVQLYKNIQKYMKTGGLKNYIKVYRLRNVFKDF